MRFNTMRVRKTLTGLFIVALVLAGLLVIAANVFRPPVYYRFGGIKSGDPSAARPKPTVKIMSPTATTPLRLGSSVDYVIVLSDLPDGQLPTKIEVYLAIGGRRLIYNNSTPIAKRVGWGVWEMTGQLLIPEKKGRFYLQVVLADLVGSDEPKLRDQAKRVEILRFEQPLTVEK